MARTGGPRAISAGCWTGVEPVISVVIPAFQAEQTIDAQLAALSAQEYGAEWEVVVADNGCSDATVERARAWADRLPVSVVDASDRQGPAAARNIGAAACRGEVLAFTDADDVVMPGWLDAIDGLPATALLATGPVRRFLDGEDPQSSTPGSRFRLLGFLSYAGGTNTIIRRSLFESLGGFREEYRTGEDVDLSWRAQLRGAELLFDERARVAARERRSGVARRYFEYGRGDVQLYSDFARFGCPSPEAVPTIRVYAGIVLRLGLLWHPAQRRRWLHQVGRRAGRCAACVTRGVFYP